MTPEELKAKARRFIEEAWNKGNWDVFEEHVAADYVRHQPPYPDIVGREAYKKYVQEVRSSYRDWRIHLNGIIAEGETVVGWGTCGGTQTGRSPTSGAPPTGKKIEFAFCSVSRYVGDKIVEDKVFNDFLGMVQQLGLVSMPTR
jgi:predicted ester cyclase